MLSVVVYGRNDSHGYNMHKRVAISLNSIAESLNMDNDEIIFVDWNTPDALPTLIEDINDTLTSKCIELLKVIRVRESDHEKLSPAGLKRPTIEPYARNIAIRNANPNNTWLLSTNTDMIFITKYNQSLSEVVQSLPRGYYQSYRFELPEFIWSTFDRSDPKQCIEKSKNWVSKTGLSKRINLDLNGIKAADAPGDFQLAPLQDWIMIKGFPESLLNGWGVDGAVIENLTKTAGLANYISEEKLISVHCNHLRSLTHFHNPKLPVNKEKNSYEINKESWGVVSSEFQRIDLRKGKKSAEKFYELLSQNFTGVNNEEFELKVIHQEISYPLLPTLHFLFDYLELNRQKSKISYIGVSNAMENALKLLSIEFGFDFSVIDIPETPISVNFWAEQLGNFSEGLLVVDLGHEVTDKVSDTDINKLSNLANSVSKLASYLRQNNYRNQISFIRAVSWSLRELVVSEFETPLFNNYGMVLTGPPRPVSLLTGLKSIPIKVAISAGIRVTYEVHSKDNLKGYIASARLGSIARKHKVMAKMIPRPMRRLIVKVLYGLARR
jgi:hypothetical protein